jgi:hypothetical protein
MTNRVAVERSLALFRSLGFFAGTALSTVELARDLVARYDEEWDKPFSPDHEWADLRLLRYDPSRVWWRDTEGFWYPGEDAYVRTLVEWAAISRGCFRPADIAERWGSGGVSITFTLAGEPCRLRAQPMGDYLDTSILVGVNELINGCQFEAYDTGGDTSLFLVVLTLVEKAALRERGWRFQSTYL